MSTLPTLDPVTLLLDFEEAVRLNLPQAGAMRDEIAARLDAHAKSVVATRPSKSVTCERCDSELGWSCGKCFDCGFWWCEACEDSHEHAERCAMAARMLASDLAHGQVEP